MAIGNTNFGNDQGTGTVGADGFLGPLTGAVTGAVNGAIGGTTPAAGAFTTLSASGNVSFGSATVAAAGSNSQAGSTALTKTINIVVTASATTRGVKLPTAATGLMVMVISAVTTNSKIYPATNGKIGTASTNASVSMAAAAGKIFIAQNTTQWRLVSTS